MDSSTNEDQPVFLDRTTRATRGKRMNTLLDDEVEEDEAFWNQEALKEEEHDDEYEEEGEAVDEFDSDFDEDVSEPDDGEQNEADAREKKTKKKLIYPGKPSTKKKTKKKDLSKLEERLQNEMKKDVSKSEDVPDDETHSGQPTTPDHADDTDEIEGEKTVRKSTRTAVVVRQAEREAIRAALEATTKPVKRRKECEEKRMSQEEMLLEAAQTEIMNLRNLERVLAREEEVKKRAIVHKPVYDGPQIGYFSKDGHTYIEFKNGASFDSEIISKPIPYPEKAVCVITGLPAKYRDPKSGLPYATKEAFQVLRERYAAAHSSSVDRKMASGHLYDLIAEQGFSCKRKRSLVAHHESSPDRRFSRIPAADDLVSD